MQIDATTSKCRRRDGGVMKQTTPHDYISPVNVKLSLLTVIISASVVCYHFPTVLDADICATVVSGP